MNTTPEPASLPWYRRAIGRRALLAGGGGLLLGGGGLGAYARYVEPQWLEVHEVEHFLPRLPAALHGLRIVHLSDLHSSDVVPDEYLVASLAAAQDARPDLIVITGDFITDGDHRFATLGEMLARLRAPLGVYAVLGNHDAWAPFWRRRVLRMLARINLPVLENRNVRLSHGGASFLLLGVEDLWTGRVDLAAAAEGAGPNDVRILLLHNPDSFPEAAEAGMDLCLAGHTHGGQVSLPLVGAPIVPSEFGDRFARGVHRIGDAFLYVSRGIGLIRPAVRFLTRPELPIHVLRCGS